MKFGGNCSREYRKAFWIMDEAVCYSYTCVGNGDVVVAQLVRCRGGGGVKESSSNGWVSGRLVVVSPNTGKGSAYFFRGYSSGCILGLLTGNSKSWNIILLISQEGYQSQSQHKSSLNHVPTLWSLPKVFLGLYMVYIRVI